MTAEIYYTRIIEGIIMEMTDGFETYGYSIDGENLNYEFQEYDGKRVRLTVEVLEPFNEPEDA